MNKEIFYKELEFLNDIEWIKTYKDDKGHKDYNHPMYQYIMKQTELLKNGKLNNSDELKIFIAMLHVDRGNILVSKYDVLNNLPIEYIDNIDEYILALTYKALKDKFDVPVNGIAWRNSKPLRTYKFNGKDIKFRAIIDELVKIISVEELNDIKNRLMYYLSEVERSLYFDDYNINLSKAEFLFGEKYNDNLKIYCNKKNIDFNRMELFINLLKPIKSTPIELYHPMFIHSASMLFTLSQSTKSIDDEEYRLMASLLDHFAIQEYLDTLATITIRTDLINDFKKLCNAYISYTSEKPEYIVANRCEKILSVSKLKDVTDLNFNENSFGYIMKEELLNFNFNNKTISKVIINLTL